MITKIEESYVLNYDMDSLIANNGNSVFKIEENYPYSLHLIV